MRRAYAFALCGFWPLAGTRPRWRPRPSHLPQLLDRHTAARQVEIHAYGLLSNHFHLIARGLLPDSISTFMRGLNGQYSQYLNGRLIRRGRLWQSRFYSCVLSDSHLIAALRYVELNPVRARLVATADDYPWSSAAIHTGKSPLEDSTATPGWLDLSTFRNRGLPPNYWRTTLSHPQSRHETAAIRFATQSETPLDDSAFIADLESHFHLDLQPKPTGRRAHPTSTKEPHATQTRVSSVVSSSTTTTSPGLASGVTAE